MIEEGARQSHLPKYTRENRWWRVGGRRGEARHDSASGQEIPKQLKKMTFCMSSYLPKVSGTRDQRIDRGGQRLSYAAACEV